MKALLIVDVQNDFCPGGSLAVPEGDEVVPVINSLMSKFEIIVASKDWHPGSSVHFGKWPVHCVQDTPGADVHPRLAKEKIRQFFLKGTKDVDDGYSAFEATNLDLAGYLKQHHVDEIYVAGLATDYCIKASAIDAVRLGFKTCVILDAVMAVNVQPTDGAAALSEMQNAGVRVVASTEIR